MNVEFWNGKHVFVTGHTGFKGSWLCLWLQMLGARVTGYSLPPPTTPSLFELAAVAQRMTSIIGDIRKLDDLRVAMSDASPGIVFHLAAQSLVRQSYHDPVETYSTNVMGTVNLFEAVRHMPGVKVVVNVTSDKCYENRELTSGYRENDPMGGTDPYSSSKGCAELVTTAYRHSFFPGEQNGPCVSVATARSGNVIGGGDWARDRLIPDLVTAIESGRPALIRNPDAVRPWQHVLDPLCGYLILAEQLWKHGPQYAESWNFGPTDEDAKPVSCLADRLTALWGNNAAWEKDLSDHPPEMHYLQLDASKARSRLGWHPKLNLETALEWTVEWYRGSQRDPGESRKLTEAQIARYRRQDT